jgi:hypothetical protein
VTTTYIYDGARVRALDAPTARPLRWAAWRPDGAHALIVGNRGQVLRFDAPAADGAAARFDVLATGSVHNLRGAAWSPDGSCALLVGNGGCVLRYDAVTGALQQLPGDRAHTMRSVAWRPDGAYALIGAYASRHAGYPRPLAYALIGAYASRHAGYPRPPALYRCDGRFVQGILATDDEDDANAIDWQPASDPPRALILVARYGDDGALLPGKIVTYDGAGYSYRSIPRLVRAADAARTPGDVVTLLGLGCHPSGDYALLCGEHGKLLAYDGQRMRLVSTGTNDNLVGPFWQPRVASPIALLLQGPDEKTYTV